MTTTVHPWAWWAWALSVAAAAGLVTNPLVLVLLAAAVVCVVLLRRGDEPWSRSLRVYATLAALLLIVRVVAVALFGVVPGDDVLLSLPELELPAWAAGVRVGGDVTAQGLLYALYDAGRLAVILLCIGAANALADPRRALRNVPAALHDVSVAAVVALTVAPLVVESVARVYRARRLRGAPGGLWSLPALVVPVLEESVDRSLGLAAGLEVRGYGRENPQRRGGDGGVSGPDALGPLALLGGLGLVLVAVYTLLGVADSAAVAAGLALGGVGLVGVGGHRAGNRLAVSRYRPDSWTAREWGLLAAGVLVLAVVAGPAAASPGAIRTPTAPPTWPHLDPWALLAAAAAAAPVLIAGPRQRRGSGSESPA